MDILNYQKVAKLVEAVTGMTLSVAEVEAIGERIVNLERVYDVREGVRREHDTLPERFLREPLKVGTSAGHVIELDLMLDEYYRVRGWDVRSGIPTARKLEELGLRDVVEDLRRMGLLPG
jgi:aldehyde:ferredoxin oxidoreductase